MIIGIDPGKTGGIVCLGENGVVWSSATPVLGKEIDWKAFATLLRSGQSNIDLVVLEHVHAMHGSSAKSTFTFGGCFEGAKALIAAFELPYTLVQPKVWQKVMWQGVPEHRKPPKKLTKKELKAKAAGKKVRTPNPKGSIDTKMMSLIAAKRLFPTADLMATPKCTTAHDGLVDALLIAEYGRRLRR